VSILYDGQNGKAVQEPRKPAIDKGAITKENMSMPAIREYLRTHPDEVVPLLNQNPSYVFFRMDMGPSLGNIGVPLTPGRSIATDSKLLPKGALAFIEREGPASLRAGPSRMVPVTPVRAEPQDTGGAIKGPGPGRTCSGGRGTEAELCTPAPCRQEGKLYFLLRKSNP